MANLTKVPTLADETHVYAVAETPRGSRAKLKFNPRIGFFTLSKPLLAGITYPYDWGFIPSTTGFSGPKQRKHSLPDVRALWEPILLHGHGA